MITVSPLLKFLDAHEIPHLIFINKMDRSEVRYRDLLQSLRDLSDRPVIPHQYAIGRGEELVGYIDLVTEQAYTLQRQCALGPDRAARGVSRARAGGAHRDARDARRLRRRPDGDAAGGARAAGRRHHAPPAQDRSAPTRSCRCSWAWPSATWACAGCSRPCSRRRRSRAWPRRGSGSIRAAPRWFRCSRPTICRIRASCRWCGCGRARSRTA